MWQKYINSLRLRIALHLATNGDCVADAKSAIAEILSNPTKYPLVDSNSENMGVKGDTQTDDFNYGKSLSQALRTGSYAAGSQTMEKFPHVGFMAIAKTSGLTICGVSPKERRHLPEMICG